MSYDIKKILDNRSYWKAKRDYGLSQGNEHTVMQALVLEFIVHGYKMERVSFEKISPDERFNDNKLHTDPDFFFYYDDKQMTFEIKVSTTGNFLHDTIYVKPSAIITMIKNPLYYPSGQLFVATHSHYATMRASKVGKYPLEVISEWSNINVQKKGFIIPHDDLEWKKWSFPVEIGY